MSCPAWHSHTPGWYPNMSCSSLQIIIIMGSGKTAFPRIGDSPLQVLLHRIFLQNSTIRIRTTMTAKSTTIITSQSSDDPSSVKTTKHPQQINLTVKKSTTSHEYVWLMTAILLIWLKVLTAKINESSNCSKEKINLCISKNKATCPQEMWRKDGKEHCHSYTWYSGWHTHVSRTSYKSLTLSEEFFVYPETVNTVAKATLILRKEDTLCFAAWK